jgi:glycolate oxidase iron-sulfur subunit
MTAPAPAGFRGADRPSADDFDRCIRCGLCLTACPTYLETFVETSGPRGRIRLMKAVAEGQLDVLAPGFVEQMSQCLGCRACEAACPSGVPYGRLLEPARAQIREAKIRSGQRFRPSDVLLRIFSHPRLLRWAAATLRFAQRSGIAAAGSALGLRRPLSLAPPIPDRFFVAENQRFPATPELGAAFLHVGCVMSVAFPQVHDATVRMLNRAGLTVLVPAEQACCGALAHHAGDVSQARELAKRNVAAFESSGADVYVVNAAGCGAALKDYGGLLAADPQWASRARAFSGRVRDVTEVLDAMDLGRPARRLDAVVTYQEPCHLAHAQRVTRAPRRLLGKIPGLTLREMDESAVCCGSAGAYNLAQPEMADRLLRRKIANVERTGASIVATANPGCAMAVAAGLRTAGYDADVRHVVELLDEVYRD